MKYGRPASYAKSHPKRPTWPATARQPATILANPFTAKVCATSLPVRTRLRCSAALMKGVDAIVEELKKLSKKVSDRTGNRTSGDRFRANWDKTIRRDYRRMPWTRLQGRHDHGRGSKNRSRRRWKWSRACKFDKGLSVALLREPTRRRWKPFSRTRYILIYEKKISSLKDLLSVAREVAKAGTSRSSSFPRTWKVKRSRLWSWNKLRGTLQSLRRQSSGLRDRRKAMLGRHRGC